MQITVPSTIGSNPVTIIINGVPYKLGAGETITVPDTVAGELDRMIDAGIKETPAVDVPFENAATTAAISSLNTAVSGLGTRMTAVETAAAAKELPTTPTTDGTYSLQIAVSSGTGTLSWEAVESSGT